MRWPYFPPRTTLQVARHTLQLARWIFGFDSPLELFVKTRGDILGTFLKGENACYEAESIVYCSVYCFYNEPYLRKNIAR